MKKIVVMYLNLAFTTRFSRCCFFFKFTFTECFIFGTNNHKFHFCGFTRRQLPRGRIFFSFKFTFHTNHTNYRMEPVPLWFRNLLILRKHHDEQLEPIVGVERNDFYKKFTEFPLKWPKTIERTERKWTSLKNTYGSSNCGAVQDFERKKNFKKIEYNFTSNIPKCEF